MKLSNKEIRDLQELAMSCVNSITQMAYMMDHVQDPKLKTLLEKHFPYHVRDYNMKTEYLSRTDGARGDLPKFLISGNIKTLASNQTHPIQPRIYVQNLNDREMATSYLLTLKRAGREYAWAAMEMADPEIRAFLQTAFLMCSAHAYDIWLYMKENGYYPAEPEETADEFIMFQPIPENQDRILRNVNYYPPTDGTNQDLLL